MAKIPDGLIAARLVDLTNGTEQSLITRAGSGCLFATRFPHGKYEIGLRFDWTDLDARGAPTLDADFYHPGSTKPVRSLKSHPAHHTRKGQDGSADWIYPFEYNDLQLQLVLVVTRGVSTALDVIIVDSSHDEGK
jgi:hypothetical protein